ERVHHLLKDDFYEGYPTICTFHSLGVHILRSSIGYLGYASNFTIYDEEDSNRLLRGCLQTLNVKKESAEFKAYRNFISQAKNQLQSPSEIDLSGLPHEFQNQLPAVYKLYQERLREANALDFDDLLFLTVKLFQQHPGVL